MSNIHFVPTPTVDEHNEAGMFVQGTHEPVSLIQNTGVWIGAAGSALLSLDQYQLTLCEDTLWLVVDDGSIDFSFADQHMVLQRGECVVIPAGMEGCMLNHAKNARLLWLTFTGPLSTQYLYRMNAYNRIPAKQGILPTQILLIRQIVQVLVRHSETGDASYQLEQLLWGLIAAHSGQSVATNATLSHEIARVVDAMRASHYRESFSLAHMASISRMPVETFRKRFTAELGIPPLGYLQFLKIERAKRLLRSGISVRQTGAEIGMPDPYHFSKQFKHVVGMSPTAYLKHVGDTERDKIVPLEEW